MLEVAFPELEVVQPEERQLPDKLLERSVLVLMTFLGFATGLRPSSLRPLRRTGPTPDVLWDQGVFGVRTPSGTR